MYAVIKTGGKQQKVKVGDVIEVEKIVHDKPDLDELATRSRNAVDQQHLFGSHGSERQTGALLPIAQTVTRRRGGDSNVDSRTVGDRVRLPAPLQALNGSSVTSDTTLASLLLFHTPLFNVKCINMVSLVTNILPK